MIQTVVSLENLKNYHKALMKTIDAKIELSTMKKTNCPNCGEEYLYGKGEDKFIKMPEDRSELKLHSVWRS